MAMVGGNQSGVGGIQLATSPVSTGGGGGGACGCFPISDLVHHTEGGGGLDTIDVSGLGTDEEWVYWVESVGAPFRLDRSAQAAGLTVDNITIEGVLGEANSRWVRLQWENPAWQSQATWFVSRLNGSDENTGLTIGSPLLSIAEWRRRIQGAHFTQNVNIRTDVNGSTVADDGDFRTGFTTEGSFSVFVVGIATVVPNGTGTLTAVQPHTANVKETITDAAQNWAGNSLISVPGANRMIRKVGGAWHAFVDQTISATEVMISPPTNCSESTAVNPTDVRTHPAINDAYEVCQLSPWPTLQTGLSGSVRGYLLDHVAGTVTAGSRIVAVLCGFGAATIGLLPQGMSCFTCNFTNQLAVNQGTVTPLSCGFMSNVLVSNSRCNWTGLENLFLGALIVASIGAVRTGNMMFFDLGTTPPLIVGDASIVELRNTDSVVGTGMTGNLVEVDSGGVVLGASKITASTTDTVPYVVNSFDSNTLPLVDAIAGGGIYL